MVLPNNQSFYDYSTMRTLCKKHWYWFFKYHNITFYFYIGFANCYTTIIIINYNAPHHFMVSRNSKTNSLQCLYQLRTRYAEHFYRFMPTARLALTCDVGE